MLLPISGTQASQHEDWVNITAAKSLLQKSLDDAEPFPVTH
jgi:hypothetical protein